MVSKGYIKIDSHAQSYVGKEINDFIDSHHLVPNPHEYNRKGLALSGNCQAYLSEMIQAGQGNIQVLPEAFNQVPGGDNCSIYVNPSE